MRVPPAHILTQRRALHASALARLPRRVSRAPPAVQDTATAAAAARPHTYVPPKRRRGCASDWGWQTMSIPGAFKRNLDPAVDVDPTTGLNADADAAAAAAAAIADADTSSPANSPTPLIYIPPLEAPQRKHDNLVASIRLRGVMPDHLASFLYFAERALWSARVPTGPRTRFAPEVKRWTHIKGPFAHAKTKENFEMKTHSVGIQCFDANVATVRAIVEYLRRNAPPSIDILVDFYEWETLGVGKALREEAATQWDQAVRQLGIVGDMAAKGTADRAVTVETTAKAPAS